VRASCTWVVGRGPTSGGEGEVEEGEVRRGGGEGEGDEGEMKAP
jgi:hypothetical protein